MGKSKRQKERSKGVKNITNDGVNNTLNRTLLLLKMPSFQQLKSGHSTNQDTSLIRTPH